MSLVEKIKFSHFSKCWRFSKFCQFLKFWRFLNFLKFWNFLKLKKIDISTFINDFAILWFFTSKFAAKRTSMLHESQDFAIWVVFSLMKIHNLRQRGHQYLHQYLSHMILPSCVFFPHKNVTKRISMLHESHDFAIFVFFFNKKMKQRGHFHRKLAIATLRSDKNFSRLFGTCLGTLILKIGPSVQKLQLVTIFCQWFLLLLVCIGIK